MGHFRFRRSFGSKFFRLNVSKGGFSVSGGIPGARLNVPLLSTRKRKAMGTLGIPGTGLSYRQEIGSSYGGGNRGSGINIPFLQQLMYVVIGLIVAATIAGWYGVF